MNRHYLKTWRECTSTEGFPRDGVLCVVFFPYGDRLDGSTVGPIAMAYHRKGCGWVYADEPTRLRFEPCYWKPFSELTGETITWRFAARDARASLAKRKKLAMGE